MAGLQKKTPAKLKSDKARAKAQRVKETFFRKSAANITKDPVKKKRLIDQQKKAAALASELERSTITPVKRSMTSRATR